MSSSSNNELATVSQGVLDDKILQMSKRPMKDVVVILENGAPRMGFPGYESKHADLVVSTLFTNAVFDQDIYAIQTIIGRIDGGIPKDVDLATYQTEFGDCLQTVLQMPLDRQAKVEPDDTVMEALCKSLVDLASTDIYTKYDKVDDGYGGTRFAPVGKKKPNAQEKKEHDAALRMILERTGGRKTAPIKPIEEERIGLAPWIMAALPQGEEDE